jgi:hypothetical protein
MLVFEERTYENFDISTNNEISVKAPNYYGYIMGKWLSHLNAR